MLYMHQIFISHSSVDGQLGWLHFLALMNRAMINMQIKNISIVEYGVLWGYTMFSFCFSANSW